MNTLPKGIILLMACLWCWAPLAQLKAIPLWVQFTGGTDSTPPPVTSGVAFRAAQSGTANSTVSPLVNYPDSTQVNDIMIVAFSTDAVSVLSGSALPSGWTLLNSTDASTDGTGHIFWKRATEANPASENWTSLFSTNQTMAYGVVSYSGCVTSGSPINASNTFSSAFSSTWTISVTTTEPNSLVVGIFCTDQGLGASFFWGTSISERVDVSNDTTGFGTGYLTIGDSLAGSAGVKTMSGNPSTGDVYAAFAYALTPAPAP